MQRYIANRTILPPGKVYINHVTELDECGRFLGIHPVDGELAYTIYVSHPTMIIRTEDYHDLTQSLKHVTGIEQLSASTIMQRFSPIRPGDDVAIVEILLDHGRVRRIQ